MWKEMAQVGIGSIFVIDSDKVLKAQQQPLTISNSCTGLPSADLPKEKQYKKTDPELDLGKVCGRIKK